MIIKSVKEGQFNIAICSVYIKDYNEAQNNIDLFQKEDSQDVEGHFVKGVVEYHLNNFDDAIIAFEKVIIVKADSYMAHNNLGVIMLLQSKFDDALKHFNTSLLIKPDYADAFYNKGVALCNLGQFEDAIR